MEALSVNRRMHEIVLPRGEQRSLGGMFFDGCHFHFIDRDKRCVHKYDQNFDYVGVVTLGRSFAGMCWDHTDGCFWGFEDKGEDIMIRLDRNFREIGTLRFKNFTRQGRHMMGISHCCERNMFTVSYQNAVFEVSKQGEHRPVLFKEPCVDIINHVCIAPYLAVVRREGRQQKIVILDRRGCMVRRLDIPCEFKVVDITHFPCHRHSDTDIMVLVQKPCRGHAILYYEMTGLCIHECHGEICRRRCEERREERGEHGGRRCHRQLCDLIESVAKVEASLAHILNGESEKLKKAVRMAYSIDELLDINRSVNKVLMNINQLEFNLHQTLEFAGDITDGDRRRGHRDGRRDECECGYRDGRRNECECGHRHGRRDECRDGHKQGC